MNLNFFANSKSLVIQKQLLMLKVRQSRKVFFKLTILLKYERMNSFICLTVCTTIKLFPLLFGRIRRQPKVLSKLISLYYHLLFPKIAQVTIFGEWVWQPPKMSRPQKGIWYLICSFLQQRQTYWKIWKLESSFFIFILLLWSLQ